MKKLLLWVVLAAVAGGLVWYYNLDGKVAPPPEIVRASVSRGPITETVQASGTLESRRRVNVGSQVSGVIKALYADFNSVVTEGQLLAEIEPTLFEVQVRLQEANLERQKNDIASQEAQVADQRRQLERARLLLEKGLQTSQSFEAIELAFKNRESQVASLKKQLVQAEANLAAARLNLGYTRIYAPIDGVVINRRVMVGQTVQASTRAPEFFLLAAPFETLKLTAWVDEADIGRVRPGMSVKFRVGTFGLELFAGTVDAVRLHASTNNSVVTYPVWISVPNADLRLRPGMTATAFIEVSDATEVTRIPNDALRFRPTRAIYAALGVKAPLTETVRAVDLAGDRVVDPTALRAYVPDEEADTIDELFAPLPRADARATVWLWDAGAREFTARPIRVGVSDGTMTELISGDVNDGDQLVTGVILPNVQQPGPPRNPFVGNQRGPGGRTGGS